MKIAHQQLLRLLKMVYKLGVGLVLISAVLVVISSLFSPSNNESSEKNEYLGISDTQNYHLVNPLEKELLIEGVSKIGMSSKKFEQHIVGGIIPHHLLASELIADFFTQLTAQNPHTIILIGPNHFERGGFKVLTSLYGWDTPYGTLDANQDVIDNLVRQGLARVNEDVLEEEHSITAITPFIRYYLPESKIVPIVLSNTITKEGVEGLANTLVEIIDENTVVIAAVDFSHYLKLDAANVNDQYTLKIINNFDYTNLFGLGNDYLDSPPSIALLLATMKKTVHTNSKLLKHTNSAEILGDAFVETTSYVTMVFY